MKRRFILLSFCLIGFLFIKAPSVYAATLYLSPGSGTIGSYTPVQIRLSTGGDGANGVSAYLAYPADKMEVVGIGYGGSFSIAAEGSYGGGGVRISRGSFGAVTGDVNVATLYFQAKNSGSATVSFIGGSAVARASDSSNSLSGTSGGTYTLTPGAGGASQSSSSQTSQQSVSPDDVTPAKITKVVISNVSTNSATISWKTDSQTNTFVEYGLEKGQYILNFSKDDPTSDHVATLSGALLTPGVSFHGRIAAKKSSGLTTNGDDFTFKLKGYQLTFIITDADKNPVKNTPVILYSDPIQGMTNEFGMVTFSDISPGKHLLVVKLKNFDKTSPVIVGDTLQQKVNIALDVSIESQSSKMVKTVAIPLIILALLATLSGFYIYKKKVKSRNKILLKFH